MNDIYQTNTYRNGVDLGNYQSVFRKKTEKINWKRLAAVDIDRIVQQNDVSILRDNIKHVAFCDLDAEMELRGGDRTLAKMFKMAQLMIDYLLSSQEHLAGIAGESEERCAALAEETDNAKRKLHDNETYISELKRECHRRKRLILAQQQIMDSGPETYHRCPYCIKAFLNGTFLQAHLEKRHSERYIRSMYLIDNNNKREESPHREHKHTIHSSSEKRIEELVRQFSEHRRESGDKNEEMDQMRRMMEDMMRQQRGEMEGVIHDLERQLQEAARREHRPRSYLGDMLDETDNVPSQREREEAVKKALNDRKRQKKAMRPTETKAEQHVNIKRQYKPTVMQKPFGTQANTSPRSPVRQISPTMMNKPTSVRDSIDSISKASEFSNFDRMWERNDQYRMEAREEVANMLAEHLEHHGIKRTAPGISDAILRDKINVTTMEQRQLSTKFIDFRDIRQRLVAEVEQEAHNKIHNRENHSPKQYLPQRAGQSPPRQQQPIVKVPSPQSHQAKITEPRKSDNARLSSDSDWDDRSGSDDRVVKMRPKEDQKRNKLAYEESVEDMLRRSPQRQSNNGRASSELSNSMDSSKWGPSESRVVTSVAPPGNTHTHKTGPTNKSSDLGNQSDSFDDA